jgi:hypothetical protein
VSMGRMGENVSVFAHGRDSPASMHRVFRASAMPAWREVTAAA